MGSVAEGLAKFVMGAITLAAHTERERFIKMEAWSVEPVGPDFAYMLRVSSEAGRTSGHVQRHCQLQEPDNTAFQFPTTGYLLADVRGAFWGIYGLLDGLGDWSHLPRYKNATWQVLVVKRDECKPDPMGGGVRVPRAWVKFSGDAVGALQIMIPYMRDQDILHRIFTDRIHDWVKVIEKC